MDLSPTWGVNPLAGHMGGRLYFVVVFFIPSDISFIQSFDVVAIVDIVD